MSNNRVEKVLAINGSPRAENGATDMIVRRFLAGASAAGAEVETIYPARLKIAPCLGDLDCWFKTPGVCRHKDDIPALFERIRDTDLTVFASPVYVDNMTSQMKRFFDRGVAFSEPYVVFNGRRTIHPSTRENPLKVVGVSVCGFPEREHFEPISVWYRRLCENMHADLIAEIYFPAAMLFWTKPGAMAEQLDAVEKAGHEAVSSGAISDETISLANSDYVGDPAEYANYLNEVFHGIRKSTGAE